MKKATSIFLLSIFLFNAMGYFVVFHISEMQMKKAMKEDLKNGIIQSAVSVIILDNSNLSSLHWTKSNEFKLNGKRYDVLGKKADAGRTTFYCVSDEKKSVLFRNMDEYVKNHISPLKSSRSASSKSLASHGVKLCMNVFFSFSTSVFSIRKNAFQSISLNYKFALIKANFQPPELA